MDWSTLVASGGVSAVVGVVVSLVAVSQMTKKQARAERADAARQEVAAKAGLLLAELARYEFVRSDEPKRSRARAHLDDRIKASEIILAAAPLPWWRRSLVERRVRRVFGDYWTSLAIDYPSTDASDTGSFAAFLASSIREANGDQRPGQFDGLMQRAYSTRAGDPLLRVLRRELRRLRSAY